MLLKTSSPPDWRRVKTGVEPRISPPLWRKQAGKRQPTRSLRHTHAQCRRNLRRSRRGGSQPGFFSCPRAAVRADQTAGKDAAVVSVGPGGAPHRARCRSKRTERSGALVAVGTVRLAGPSNAAWACTCAGRPARADVNPSQARAPCRPWPSLPHLGPAAPSASSRCICL